jgi:hypothetical protein
MTRVLLALTKADADAATDYDEVLLWGDSTTSTFTGTTGPGLEQFGKVPALNRDFVRIALSVFAADRSVSRERGGSNWNARDFDVTVPVSAPRRWQRQADELAQLVGFLTGDRWSFAFKKSDVGQADRLPLKEAAPERVVLMSGGADSAVGALLSRHGLAQDERHTLVSHYSLTTLSPIQQSIAKAMSVLVPNRGEQMHHQVHLNRGSTRLDGTAFPSEASSRSRSLLFLALGLAAAASAKVPLWIPENGFASLNPPLGPDRRGSLSTRTTHPRYLSDLQACLQAVGAHAVIENPFAAMTKGEMFRWVAETFGAEGASDYLSQTNSCSHTDARYSGAPAASSCGVCFGCIVRRAAFAAADLDDLTTYLSDDAKDAYSDYVLGKSIEVSAADFVRAGVSARAVMAMSLPASYPPGEALDLCQRGLEELRGYLL